MAYKIKFENGHTVSFDSEPSESDIDEAFSHTQTLGPKTKPEADWGTAFKQKLAEAGNAADAAISLPAGALASVFSQEAGDEVFRAMDARRAANLAGANPDKLPLSTAQQISGTLATFPGQMLGMMGGAAEKGMDLINRGEPLSRAIPATLIEGGLTAAGVGPMMPAKTFMGRAAIGAGANIATGMGSDAATQLLATQEATKAAYDPYDINKRIIEGVTGGVLQGKFGERPIAETRISKIRTEQAAKEATKAVEPTVDTPTLKQKYVEDIPLETREAQSAINRGAPELEVPPQRRAGESPVDQTNQLELPLESDVVNPIAKREMENSNQLDLFENRQPDVVDPSIAKQEQMDMMFEGRPLTDEYAAQRQAEVAAREQQEVDLARVEQQLRDSAYQVEGNQQGPKTRAEKAIGMRGFASKQSGAIEFGIAKGSPLDKLKQIFKAENLDAATMRDQALEQIPPDPDLDPIIKDTVDNHKNGKQWNMLQSGVTSVSMKTKNPVIQAYGRIMQGAGKVYELSIRHFVFPAEQTLKRMSLPELTELATIFKDEAFQGKRYDPEILVKNLTAKQMAAYQAQRVMLDDALDIQNSARLSRGLDPVTPMEAYLAYRYKGDFRRPIYEKTKDGKKLVWYIAGQSKMSVEAQTKALLKDRPDLIIDPKLDHQVRSQQGKADLDSAYTKLLDILGRNDPAVMKIKELLDERMVFEGDQVMGQPKHFEKKAGIRGFVGDRPGFRAEVGGVGVTLKRNPSTEALAMFQEQIQYAKNGYKWAAMQDAVDKVKPIISNPELNEKQPNNVAYMKAHFKNSLGMGEGAAAKLLDDSLRQGLGVSPTVLKNAVGDIKSFFILQKLGANLAYSGVSMLQTSNVLPYMAQLISSGYKGNPISAISAGMIAGPIMGLSHYMMGQPNAKAFVDNTLGKIPELKFYHDAIKYAEANSVTSRSVADESPIRASHSVLGKTGLVLAKGMTIPETFSRSMAFMSYAQLLKDSGKFKDNASLFQKAEEMVNKSMVDYRAEERPLIFAKLGTMGDMMNTLQTYPMSFLNQYSYMLKEASRGNPTGLLAMMGTQALIGGAMGLPYLEDMDKLFKTIRDTLPTKYWNEAMKSPFMSDPKLWVVENMGKSALWGALSEKTGLGITSRVAAPTTAGMLQAPGGPVLDLAKQAGNWGSAILEPTNEGKWAQAVLGTVPTGVQGVLENLDFMKDYTFVDRPDGKGSTVVLKSKDLAKRSGGYVRSPEETTMRKFGFRSQKEVAEKELTYGASTRALEAKKRGGELIGAYYDAIRQGDKAKAGQINRLYQDVTESDNGIQDAALETQQREEFLSDYERLRERAETSTKAAIEYARIRKVLEATK